MKGIDPMEHSAELGRATRLVNAKIGFYIHLAAFVSVNALLILINLATTPAHFWFQWPLLGWGLGLLIHALVILGLTKGSSVRAQMIEREMRRAGKN
jgi:hypothetical protein